ncbi:isopeptide-forming domain-containing fimbrial protein [Fusibacillus kribbianus]|uniref:Isopeptide-forming domain-containing fimbrial protein n=1 Tax=Fusibacillus kribbianus TaxID=3044208 RepID=A0AAP4BB23_9FIRM|nr:isopeptide-forming domain-containing fimbrial protein [Ruminococcus sp. YH-rum2234]MDI9241144.1 isopeptide-forming domain-containing fimbrial protein [Ruminococcus sp. YH-rum2234]
MRRTKKFASLLLALIMVFSLGITAFAEENTHTYEIYQIFTGDYSDGILSNVKWGKNGTGIPGDAVDSSILEKLEAVAGSASDTAQLAVINKYAKLSTAPYTSGTATSYENLPNGYYLVKDQDGTQNTENGFYTLYVVKVVNGTLEFEPKGDVPEAEKKIVEGANKVDVNEASIGDTVNYEITGTLPTNFDDYNTYYYVFTDTLSKGLTYKNDVKVTVGGVDVTKYFYVNAADYSATDGTTIKVGIQDIKALNLLAGVTVTKDSKIVVTYSATLNENAVIAGEGNPNDVKLTYSNDPNNSGTGATTSPGENPDEPSTDHPTGETPKDQVVTYTTELTILKKNDEGKVLPGAEFTLTGDSVNIVLVTAEKFTVDDKGEYWKLKDGTYTTTAPTIGGETDNSEDYANTATKYSKTVEITAKGTGKDETSVVGVVDEGGHVTFTGLGVGTYTITETKTPAGYNTIAPITFTLTFDAGTKAFASNNTAVAVGADNKLDTTIVNEKGATLPETGGMGTTIFYVIGSVLVLGAAVLLIVKRRMRAERQ